MFDVLAGPLEESAIWVDETLVAESTGVMSWSAASAPDDPLGISDEANE